MLSLRSVILSVLRHKSICRAAVCRQFRSGNGYAAFADKTTDMSKQSYWEEFYRKKHPALALTRDSITIIPASANSFDWFFPYKVAQPWLLHHIDQQKAQLRETHPDIIKPLQVASLQVLELGCGTSDVGMELFMEDITLHIQCIDFSEEAIKTMQAGFSFLESEQGEEEPGLNYSQCDIAKLPFADARFHVCYEKGTIDAVLKANSFEVGASKAVVVINEVARTLSQNGVFLQFSDDLPERRLPILERAKVEIEKSQNRHFSVSFKDIGDFSGIDFFMYVMKDQGRI